MTAIDPRTIRLLREALELPLAEREDFVIRACGDDAHLLESLRELVALDLATGLPLDLPLEQHAAPLLGDDAEQTSDIRADMRLGPWRLLRELGRGGMGAVWLAERDDGQFQQQVAIKLIRLGMDSEHILRQFRRERALLARLQHPNIAQLIDGGIDDRGRPWFAMEYVDGISLGEWLEREQASLRERLQLFIKLCSAVAHAHRQLIVHRDLKPSNVLVQADGEPRLLDFGIARLIEQDEGEHTATVQRFLTRDFAAPEQLRGEPAGTSADVYALGLIPFELLTDQRYRKLHADGATTLRPSTAPDAQRVTASDTITRAQLRGDLDAITLRALADEPARRYGDAQQLADDVQRHLDGQPVQARPDSLGYRSIKFVRRNRFATAMAVLALIGLLGGLAASLWQAGRADREARRATAVKDYLIGLFDAGRTNQAGAAALQQPLIEVLDASAALLPTQLGKEPELRDEIYRILIEIYDANGQGERSIMLATQRLTQAQAAFGALDARTAPALLMLAGVYLNHDRPDEAAPLLEHTQHVLDRAGESDSLPRALLLQYRGAWASQREGGEAAARRDLAAACAILRQRFADSDELLVALIQLIQVELGQADAAAAQALIDELRSRTRARFGSDHLYLTQADFLEARLLAKQGQPEQALQRLRDTRGRLEHFGGPQHADMLIALTEEIPILLTMNRLGEAEAVWLEAERDRLAYHAGNPAFASLLQGLRERLDEATTARRQPAAASGGHSAKSRQPQAG